MRNEIMGTGKAGINPARKVKIIVRGVKFGILSDMSVAYKLVLSAIILVMSFISTTGSM